jgi:hypothetical protein
MGEAPGLDLFTLGKEALSLLSLLLAFVQKLFAFVVAHEFVFMFQRRGVKHRLLLFNSESVGFFQVHVGLSFPLIVFNFLLQFLVLCDPCLGVGVPSACS